MKNIVTKCFLIVLCQVSYFCYSQSNLRNIDLILYDFSVVEKNPEIAYSHQVAMVNDSLFYGNDLLNFGILCEELLDSLNSIDEFKKRLNKKRERRDVNLFQFDNGNYFALRAYKLNVNLLINNCGKDSGYIISNINSFDMSYIPVKYSQLEKMVLLIESSKD
jgi:hypothetical protein